MNNVTFIIFGASGDLARRKIIPAIYALVAEKKLTDFLIIGAAIEELAVDQWLEHSYEYVADGKQEIWQEIRARACYQRLNFVDGNDFVALSTLVEQEELRHGLPGKRMLYCAAIADFFGDITQNAVRAKLITKRAPEEPLWQRIVYEKPFGHSLTSAHVINQEIHELLHESQIYRTDHYLSAELVSNIALLRFTNIILEPLWNNAYIENVQIVLSESMGIGTRGSYYDRYGALRDIVQNHMLELVALLAMEAPEWLEGEYIRAERAKVLAKVKITDGILGQYDGYREEELIPKDSTTETFAALCLTIDNPRWQGVPFFLKTGKYLQRKETTIHIKFKEVHCRLTDNCPTDSNYLTIKILPEASFFFELNAKQPGHSTSLMPIRMSFNHQDMYGPMTPEAYEVVLTEIVKGRQAVSVRFDEIEHAWRALDAVYHLGLPLYEYEKGSAGPKELKDFEKKYAMRWRS